MICEQAKMWMNDALDGRLTEGDRRALSAHLAACPACEAEQAQWRDLDAMLDRAAAADATVRAPEALLAALNLETAAPAPKRRWWPAGLVAAGMLVLAGVVALGTLPKEAPLSASAPAADEITTAEAIHGWLDPEAQAVAFEL